MSDPWGTPPGPPPQPGPGWQQPSAPGWQAPPAPQGWQQPSAPGWQAPPAPQGWQQPSAPGWQAPPAPQGWQQPGYPAPGWQQPTRRRRRWPWIVAAVGVVLVLVVGVVAFVGTRFVGSVRGANRAVDTYLGAVERGDQASAQSLLCASAPSDAVQRSFDSHVVSHHIVGTFVRETSGQGESADVTVDVTLAGGVHHRDTVLVVVEHDRWLVCGVDQRS